MKKLFIAAAGLAAVTAFGAWGHHLGEEAIKACNAGNVEECQSIAEIHGTDYIAADRITNPAYAEALKPIAAAEAKAKAEAAAKAKEASKWQPTAYNISNLALACENTIKPALKDPRSFRRLDEGMSDLTDNNVTVWVNYSATNSFGGRVQDTHSCTYTR